MAVERVLSNLNLISFKTEGGLQNHIDELQDGDLVFTPDNSLKGNLFDFKWTDHKLNDISWLNADTFSWQSGDVYVAAYEHLVADVQGKEYISETIEGHTIWYRLADDGHKIVTHASDYDGSANVNYIYEATGVAWYYILDQENKQFKLPRTQFGFTGLRDEVGKYVSAGLPNISGNFNAYTYGSGGDSGAVTSKISTSNTLAGGSQSSYNFNNFSIDASRSSSVYNNSDTVQPKATQMYLYFYVGNFERDALEQTAGITSEQLNNKLDKSAEIYLVPSGSVTAFAGTTPPAGWLKCDGSAISRTTYAVLFNVIGTTYGAGDGSTTFNLPTQSVLPLGTSAKVAVYGTSKSIQVNDGTNNASLAAGLAIGSGNRVGVGTKTANLNKGDQSSGFAQLKNDATIGLKTGTAYGDSGIVGTADIANATGAKAIVCIKY